MYLRSGCFSSQVFKKMRGGSGKQTCCYGGRRAAGCMALGESVAVGKIWQLLCTNKDGWKVPTATN